MFGRLTGKLRKDDKPSTQTEKTDGKVADAVVADTVVADTDKPIDKAEETAADGGPLGATASRETDSLGAESIKDIPATDVGSTRGAESTLPDKSDLDESRSQDLSYTGAAATVATGGAGAGGLAWATSRNQDEGERASISSYSTEADQNDRDSLQQVETAHSVLPLQSPAVEGRPNLERHITTISTSSGESDSDDLLDSSDDEREGRPQTTIVTTSKSQEAPAGEEGVSPLREEEKAMLSEPGTRTDASASVITPVGEQTAASPIPAAGSGPEAPSGPAAQAEPTVIEPRIEEPAKTPAPVQTDESAAAAPTIATGPRAPEQSKAKEEKHEKEKRGLRGLISRLKGGDSSSSSRGENKLQKNRSPPESEKKSSFQGGAKFTGQGPTSTGTSTAEKEKDDSNIITPVTTTSAGKELDSTSATGTTPAEQPLPLHIDTDGPIGDPSGRVSGVSENPRPTSVSSFQRHAAPSKDLDDVSSSGAEEDDLGRGRGAGAKPEGLAAKRFERGDSDEQFEEARDHFDESLAPPAAFAGQMKSQSPVRETKFTERF